MQNLVKGLKDRLRQDSQRLRHTNGIRSMRQTAENSNGAIIFTQTCPKSGMLKDARTGELQSCNGVPSRIDEDGVFLWHEQGELHRDSNRPAWENPNGTDMYFENGEKLAEKSPDGEITYFEAYGDRNPLYIR